MIGRCDTQPTRVGTRASQADVASQPDRLAVSGIARVTTLEKLNAAAAKMVY